MSATNIADLRDRLSDLMDQLGDTTKTPDYDRIRASCEVAAVIVGTVRVQVDYLRVIQGDGDVKFLEEPAGDITAIPPKVLDPLHAGPAPDHPWRAGRVVHRIGRS